MFDLGTFAHITGTAGKRQVVIRVRAAAYSRADVLDFELEVEYGFGSVAVFVAVSCP